MHFALTEYVMEEHVYLPGTRKNNVSDSLYEMVV